MECGQQRRQRSKLAKIKIKRQRIIKERAVSVWAKCDSNVCCKARKMMRNLYIYAWNVYIFMNLKETCRRHIFYICHANWIIEQGNVQILKWKKKSDIRQQQRKSKAFKFRRRETMKKIWKEQIWNWTDSILEKNKIPDLILWCSKTYTKYH